MAGSNPAFTRSPAFSAQAGGVAVAQDISAQQLDEIYNRSSAPAEGETMTVENTIVKTVISFILLLAGAAIGWITAPAVPLLWIGAAIVAFVLALVNIFKKEPSAPLILAYAAAEGVFIGGIEAQMRIACTIASMLTSTPARTRRRRHWAGDRADERWRGHG